MLLRRAQVIALAAAMVLTVAGRGPAAEDRGAAAGSSVELVYWQSVKDSHSAAELQSYLDKFPDGLFAPLARLRIKELQRGEPAQPATRLQKEAAQARPSLRLPLPSLTELVAGVEPAVVTVDAEAPQATAKPSAQTAEQNAKKLSPEMEEFFKKPGVSDKDGAAGAKTARSHGCGFFVSADGFIVTAMSVVKSATAISVVLGDGEQLPATLVGTDPRTDIALLKVAADRKFSYLNFTGEAARVGDWILSFGNPYQVGRSVSLGIISGTHRNIHAGPYDDFLQVDAVVNKGDSGGPVVNLDGNVVGMNAAIISPSGGSIGIAFALRPVLLATWSRN
jgi:serine protease Do